MTAVSFISGKKKNKKGAKGVVIYLALWAQCLCVYVVTCDYVAAWCQSVALTGWFTPLGKTVQAKRSDKVASAVLSEWTHINTLRHTH